MDGAGTVVQLPAAPAVSTAAGQNGAPDQDTLTVNNIKEQATAQNSIAKRNASREERKRELLIEARKARIDWILGGVTDDTQDLKEVLKGKKNPLRELQACGTDGIACAPDVIEALFSSKLQGGGERSVSSSKIAAEVKRILENEHLSWENVSSSSSCANQTATSEEESNQIPCQEQPKSDQSTLILPPVPSAQSYNVFLQILCQPDAADVVFSMQKFCKTIDEAAKVILSVQEDEMKKDLNAKSEKEKLMMHQHQPANDELAKGDGLHVRYSSGGDTTQQTEQTARGQPQQHTESLAKAVRGFIKTTFRDIQSHDAFKEFPNTNEECTNNANEELMACLETFVFTKCHSPIYRVLGSELEYLDHDGLIQTEVSTKRPKSVDQSQLELNEKLKLLQFVTPKHLEIQCLKFAPENDVDLSTTIGHLQSMKQQPSPRQKLRSILLAYRGINSSLNAVLNKHKRDTPSPSPPSADDVLPTLILAVLRAQPDKIVTDLRLIEFFAAVPLLRGEAGYAYTNLCGAIQFLSKLDMEGHAAEVSLGEEGAHLSISPDDFRAGIEQSKLAMEIVEDKISKEKRCGEHQEFNSDDTLLSQSQTLHTTTNISGRDIREARANGEAVNIDWALKKQNDMGWQDGRVVSAFPAVPTASSFTSNLPPEEPPLPAHFNRSYSYLSTRPEDIRIGDLPMLLNEYRMLVHATESLLNERSTWREAEKKRQMQLARSTLERDFNEVIGQSFNTDAANSNKLEM